MLKIRYILFLLCALTVCVSAWGLTSTISEPTINGTFNTTTKNVKWSEDHVDFTFFGSCLYREFTFLYMPTGKKAALAMFSENTGATYYVSWTVEYGYQINVETVTFEVDRATGTGYIMTVGNGLPSSDLFFTDGASVASGTLNYGNSQIVSIIVNKGNPLWSTIRVKSIQITYTLTPLFIFDGSGDGAGDPEHTDWGKPDNWVLNTLPTSTNDVIIRHDVVITEIVEAKSVTIESPNKVTVAPTGVLKVGDGGIIGATEDNFKLEAAQTGTNKGQTGALLINPGCSTMPSATVEMFSKAYFDMEANDRNNVGSYQYIGSPMVAGAAAKTIFPNSWVYSWYEDSGEWKNKRKTLTLEPFVGYCTSQYASSEGILIEHKGQLASNGNRVLDLSYTATSAEPGINVLANSYTAPIDIKQFVDGDFSGVDATIYLFNTGSKNQAAEHDGDYYGDAAGQFIEIPIHQAGKWVGSFQWPFVIPAMQGFYVKANSAGSTLTLNYTRLVWEASHSNTPLRAKRAEEQQKGSLCVMVEADGWKDQVFLLESEEYDAAFENGYDAHKLMQGNLNIFTIEGDEALAVDATNRIAGTKIGVRTGEETAYTLTFGALSGEAEWSLYDAETQATIDIEEGMQYTFFAEPNSEIRDRFYITERNDAPAITTDLEEVNTGAASHKFIKDGRLYVIKNGLIYNTLGVAVSR